MILNVGCGGRPHDKNYYYGDVRIDIEEFPNVTHVMDAHNLPEEWTEKFNHVEIDTTIEHVDTPIKVLREASRVLISGGTMTIIVPNVMYWRRIIRNYRCDLDTLNAIDPEKLPDHKAAWDLVEFTNFIKQVPGLKIVDVDYLDWQPEFRHVSKDFWGKLIDKYIPKPFRYIEVKYMLRKDDKVE